MFKFVCLCILISTAYAASVGKVESTTEKREIIPLLSYERENNPDGSFKFSYEGGDKTFREESARVVDAGTENEALEITGSYRYIDDEGRTIEVHYTAGRNGFVPVGTNILPEISAVAKAAADLPSIEEEELKRKGRSNNAKEKKVTELKKVENKEQSLTKNEDGPLTKSEEEPLTKSEEEPAIENEEESLTTIAPV